jgi:simple sugar transport system ATP-binding protein
VGVQDTTKEQMSEMMVGRKVDFVIDKAPMKAGGRAALVVQNLTVRSKHHGKALVNNVSFTVHRGEILCIAGIDGNGQSELVYALTGLLTPENGRVYLGDREITRASIRERNDAGLAHIPEDRHKHGLVLDYTLAENAILKSYHKPAFRRNGFIRFDKMFQYADRLIDEFDIRSGQGARTLARSMSGGNQQKVIVARELSEQPEVLIAVQPTRGLDVGAIEYIHRQLVVARDQGKAVLLVSLELDEVMNLSDRILVIYEGEIVANVDAKGTTVQELGLYMAGSRRGAAI